MIKFVPQHEDAINALTSKQVLGIIEITIDRIQVFSELPRFTYIFEDPDFSSKEMVEKRLNVFKSPQKSTHVLTDILKALQRIPADIWNRHDISKIIGEYHFKNKDTLSHKDIYHLLRFVLTGFTSGPSAVVVMEILGKDVCYSRIKKFL